MRIAKYFGGAVALPNCLSSWLFAFSLTLAPIDEISVAAHVTAGDVLFMAAVFCAICERMVLRERIAILPWFLVGACVLTLCFVIDEFDSHHSEWNTYLVIMTMIILFPQSVLILRIRNVNELNFMMYAWALGGVIGAAYTVAYCNGYFPTHDDPFWYWNHRARGLTPHPNRLGLNCYMTLPGLLMLVYASKHLVGKLTGVLLIVLVLKALDYSGSRAGMLAAFVLLGTWLMLHLFELWKSRRQYPLGFSQILARIALALVCAVITVLVAGGSNFLANTWQRLVEGDRVSDSSRDALNQMAWNGFLDNPIFGAGYRWFGFFDPNVAHNIYLQYLHAVGILGFLTFLVVMLYPLRYPLRQQFSSLNANSRNVNIALISAVVALLIWLRPQSGFTHYTGLLATSLLLYVSIWRLYDRRASLTGAS